MIYDFEKFYDDFFTSNMRDGKLRKDMQEYNIKRSDIKFLKRVIVDYKDYSVDDVVKAVILYVFYSSNDAIKFCRDRGTFSYRGVADHEPYAIECINIVNKYKKYLKINESNTKYIESKCKLTWIANIMQKAEKQIEKYIQSHEQHKKSVLVNKDGNSFYAYTSIFRELIAYIEMIFLMQEKSFVEDDSDLNILSSYSQEELCEAVSFLLFKCLDNNIECKDNSYLDADYVLSNELNDILLKTCKFLKLCEWDFLFDHYDYDYDANKETLYNKDETFVKSITLGYIETQIQKIIFFQTQQDEDIASLKALMKKCFHDKKLANWLVEKTGADATERYILRAPIDVLEKIGEKVNNRTSIYKEDAALLGYSYRENIPSVYDRFITEHATLMDALLVQRLFSIHKYYYDYILKKETDAKAIIRTMGAMVKHDELKMLINSMIGDYQKTDELIDFFTYKKGRFDIQYVPFIKCGEYYCIPTVICTVSNVIRNAIAYAYQSKNNYITYDTGEEFEEKCYELFKKHKNIFRVYRGRKFSYKHKEGEVDLLAITENEIFIFECKNPLLPVDSYSMRSTYADIQKAGKQLDLSLEAFGDKNFRNEFFTNNGIDNHERKIYSGIILGNRVFSGYRGVRHPIRPFHVLDMIMNKGWSGIRANDKNIKKKKIWIGEKFSIKDLIIFLTDEINLIDKVFFNSMVEYHKVLNFNNNRLRIKSYKLDTKKLLQNLFNYNAKDYLS